jgi:hypothetical protein
MKDIFDEIQGMLSEQARHCMEETKRLITIKSPSALEALEDLEIIMEVKNFVNEYEIKLIRKDLK